ncbi:hypothetical protein AHAS_Ahas19G0293900 [Arachis hypogaea]
MVVNVKVLKKLFSVNNFQKKPRRRLEDGWLYFLFLTEMIDPEPMEKPPPLLSKQGYDAALGFYLTVNPKSTLIAWEIIRVVKNVASQSLKVKKLMYLYLLHYSENIRIQVKSGNKVSDYSNASLKNYAVWANSAVCCVLFSELKALLHTVPEVARLIGAKNTDLVLRTTFTHLMSANKERVTEAVNSLKFRLHDESKDISEQFNHTNSLKLIARAHLAIRHPASGYVQGINDLVTPFLVVFLSEHLQGVSIIGQCLIYLQRKFLIEADCYWCLSRLQLQMSTCLASKESQKVEVAIFYQVTTANEYMFSVQRIPEGRSGNWNNQKK